MGPFSNDDNFCDFMFISYSCHFPPQVRPVRDSMIDAVQLWKKLTGEDANGNDPFVWLSSVPCYLWFYYIILTVKQLGCNRW